MTAPEWPDSYFPAIDTCPRCRRDADRLIRFPNGTQLCPTCAYPARGAPDHEETHRDHR
jgi:predicted amidophosphoribosyltransferase